MNIHKKFKMLFLKAEAALCELDMLNDDLAEHEQIFKSDFSDAYAFLIDHNDIDLELEQSAIEKDQQIVCPDNSIIKILHRELIKKTHPDKTDLFLEDFKEIQHAFDKKDIITLLRYATLFKIDFPIEQELINQIENSIKSNNEKIEKLKKTVKWIWINSDKNQHLKEEIMSIMGVDKKAYDEWIQIRSSFKNS